MLFARISRVQYMQSTAVVEPTNYNNAGVFRRAREQNETNKSWRRLFFRFTGGGVVYYDSGQRIHFFFARNDRGSKKARQG